MPLKSLFDLNPGEKAVIQGFQQEMPLQSRLVEMGILPGVEIRLVKKTPVNGPVALKVRGYYVSIRSEDAANILVN